MPLGVLEGGRYEEQDIQLRVVDLVLCYTDPLTESVGTDGRMLGPNGLLELVRTLDATRPESFIASLLAAVAAPHDGNLDGDDVTVLLFRPNGLAPRVPLGKRLRAPLLLVGGLLRSLRRRGEPIPWPELSLPNIGGAVLQSLNRLWRAPPDDEAADH